MSPSPNKSAAIRIAVLIPAFNEEGTIAKVIVKAKRHANYVIVCDDGSSDMTREIAESMGAVVIRHDKNMGKGAALRSLFDATRAVPADVIVTLDGDGQHNSDEVPSIVRPILDGEGDIAIGSRFNGRNRIPLHRRVGNRLLDFITNLRASDKIEDTQSGFRAYSRKAIELLDVVENGMGVDSQIILDARKAGLRIVDRPISVSYRGDTSTLNPVRHLGEVIISIIRYSAEKRPLLLVGLPGLAALGLGLGYGTVLLLKYESTKEFLLGYAFMAIGATLAGTFAILVSLTLYALSNVLKKVESLNNKSGNHPSPNASGSSPNRQGELRLGDS